MRAGRELLRLVRRGEPGPASVDPAEAFGGTEPERTGRAGTCRSGGFAGPEIGTAGFRLFLMLLASSRCRSVLTSAGASSPTVTVDSESTGTEAPHGRGEDEGSRTAEGERIPGERSATLLSR